MLAYLADTSVTVSSLCVDREQVTLSDIPSCSGKSSSAGSVRFSQIKTDQTVNLASYHLCCGGTDRLVPVRRLGMCSL